MLKNQKRNYQEYMPMENFIDTNEFFDDCAQQTPYILEPIKQNSVNFNEKKKLQSDESMLTSQEKTTHTINSLNECDEGEKANLPYQQINPQKMQEFLEHTQLLMQFRNLGLTSDLKYIEQEDIEKTKKKMKELGLDQFSKTFSHKEMMQGQCFKLRDLQKQLVQQNQNYKNYSEFEEAPLEEKQEIMQLLVDTQRQILEKVHYPYKERADNYFFPILQKEKINEVERIFQMPLNEQNKNQKINQNTDITYNDLKTLNGLVNDNVINKYLELINQDVVYPKKTMNSYFFQFLNNQEVDWKKIFRIADRKKIDIKNDIIYVPMYLEKVHWAFCEINCKQQKITFFDSLLTSFKNLNAQTLPMFLEKKLGPIQKFVTKYQEHCKFQPVPFQLKVGATAIQEKGKNCGIFICKAIHYKMIDYNISFTQNDIEYFKQLMGIELMQNKLI